MIHIDDLSVQSMQRVKVDLTTTHNDHSGTMADINKKHTWIDEDQTQIEEKRMREFERRDDVSVNEWYERIDRFLIGSISHLKHDE